MPTAFFYRNDYIWRATVLATIGFLRAYIQLPYALVISDEYKEDFATAFSLTLFICGIVNAILGPSMSKLTFICLSINKMWLQ